jgi:hypothetical protein
MPARKFHEPIQICKDLNGLMKLSRHLYRIPRQLGGTQAFHERAGLNADLEFAGKNGSIQTHGTKRRESSQSGP